MTINKKILLTSVLAAVCATTASAAERVAVEKKAAMAEKSSSPVTVTIGGSLDTQIGYNGQKSQFNTDNFDTLTGTAAGKPLHKQAIVNDTKLKVKIESNAHGMKYGGHIVLNADTSGNKYSRVGDTNNVGYQTSVFAESRMGRLEAGSTTGVYEAMKVNAGSFARATGGVSGDTRWWWNQDFARGELVNPSGSIFNIRGTFVTAPSLPTNFSENLTANAAKISFMTQSFGGVKAGLTYIPDTEQYGSVTTFSSVARNQSTTLTQFDATNSPGEYRTAFSTSGYKNVFQGGLHYSGKFDKSQFKLSALGEMGKAKDSVFGTTSYTAKRNNLRAWELGANATFSGVTVGGSWGSWGKSGMFKSLTPTAAGAAVTMGGKTSTKYYTLGAAYEYGPMGASLTYINSTSGGFGAGLLANKGYSASKGKFNMFTLGFDYKLAPGFMPYAEVSQFTMKDGANVVAVSTGVAGAAKNSGTIVLAGTKLHLVLSC